MDLTTLIQTSKGLYGLEKTATQDGLFTDSVMTDMVNLAHQSFASVARPYYKTLRTTLPLGTTATEDNPDVTGTSVVTLDPTVIEVDVYSVRVGTSGLASWRGLPFKPMKEILKAATDGAIENTPLNSTPTHFFLRPGAADNAGRVLEIYPGLSAQVTNGVKYNAWVYPPDLGLPTDKPELQPAEHYRLLPWICWQMALLERSRGRDNAPVAEWYAVAMDVAVELYNILWRSHQGIPRTAEVGLSSGEDALWRRTAMLRRGGGGG